VQSAVQGLVHLGQPVVMLIDRSVGQVVQTADQLVEIGLARRLRD
jgi:hypothetical protein